MMTDEKSVNEAVCNAKADNQTLRTDTRYNAKTGNGKHANATHDSEKKGKGTI